MLGRGCCKHRCSRSSRGPELRADDSEPSAGVSTPFVCKSAPTTNRVLLLRGCLSQTPQLCEPRHLRPIAISSSRLPSGTLAAPWALRSSCSVAWASASRPRWASQPLQPLLLLRSLQLLPLLTLRQSSGCRGCCGSARGCLCRPPWAACCRSACTGGCLQRSAAGTEPAAAGLERIC